MFLDMFFLLVGALLAGLIAAAVATAVMAWGEDFKVWKYYWRETSGAAMITVLVLVLWVIFTIYYFAY